MKVLLTGSGGQVGKSILSVKDIFTCLNIVGYTFKELDITSEEVVLDVFSKELPDIVINAAAYTAVDKAENEPEKAYEVNAKGAMILAMNCERLKIPLLHISTDYVFDGNAGGYKKEDKPNPINVYGASKLAGEISAVKHCSRVVVVRTSWVFSEFNNNFLKTIVRLSREKSEINVVSDQVGCPTSARHIALVLLRMADSYAKGFDIGYGIYHFSGTPYLSWYQFAEYIVSSAEKILINFTKPVIKKVSSEDYRTAARRPKDSRLLTSKELSIYYDTFYWFDEVDRVIHELKNNETKENI